VLPDKIYQSILSGFSRNKSTAEQHVLPDSIRQSILYKLYFINSTAAMDVLTTEPTIFYQRFVATTPLRLPYFQIDYTN
jgi:hypothetical protein